MSGDVTVNKVTRIDTTTCTIDFISCLLINVYKTKELKVCFFLFLSVPPLLSLCFFACLFSMLFMFYTH